MLTVMGKTTIGAVLTAVGVLASATAYAQSAAAQSNCDWYAKTALRQQQENEQKRCNFKGDGWGSDLRSHVSWCMANPDQWKSEAQRREQMLSGCRK